jgi:hypothetical protein
MPLFFFDVTDDCAPNHSDPLGTEMEKADIPDEAVDLIAGITADRLPDGLERTFAVSVRDNEGAIVFGAKITLVAGWK